MKFNELKDINGGINMSELEYKKIHDEWVSSKQEFEKTLNKSSIAITSEPQHKGLIDSAWNTGKSFVSGLFWIVVVFLTIVSVLYWLGF